MLSFGVGSWTYQQTLYYAGKACMGTLKTIWPICKLKRKKVLWIRLPALGKTIRQEEIFLHENSPTYFAGESVRTVRQTFVEVDLCRGGPL